MATLINTDFFIGSLELPGRTNAGTAENLTLHINRYEPMFLQKALGYALWKQLEANKNEVSGVYYNLIHGEEYSVDGTTYYWQGLANTALLISPIANYVYYQYRKATFTRTDSVGENTPDAKNARVVSAGQKMINAWNDMVDMLYSLKHYLDNSTDDYPDWQGVGCQSYQADFHLWEKMNVFGI